MLGGYDIFKEAESGAFGRRRRGPRCGRFLLRRLYPYMAGMGRQPQAYLERFFQVGREDLSKARSFAPAALEAHGQAEEDLF